MPRKAVSKGGRGKHWSELELARLARCIQQILPCGPNEWSRVANMYNMNRPHYCHERDVDAIVSKYKSIKRLRKPSGDPNMPAYVGIMKQCAKEIEDKASVFQSDVEEAEEEEDVGEEAGGASSNDAATENEETKDDIDEDSYEGRTGGSFIIATDEGVELVYSQSE